MAIRLSRIKDIVRGIVVDRLSDGITPFFSDAEVLAAVNITKGGFFGMRPEAFCVDSVLTAPPPDFPALPDSISITGTDEPDFTGEYVRAGMRWEFGDDYALWHDSLWYLTDGTTTYTAPDNGLNIPPEVFARTITDPEEQVLTASITAFTVGQTVMPPSQWIDDSEVGINEWAVTQFCYGVAAFLLMQRGKDAFYREAAAALQKLYVGR